MYNITLICTRHEGIGKCNSDELENIIININPEIIFEELSKENFDRAYNTKKLYTLETSAIKFYKLNHELTHFPVDTYERPKNHDEEVDHLYDIVKKSDSKESRDFMDAFNRQKACCRTYGFRFLNSDYNDALNEEIEILKDKAVEILNDERLLEIRKREKKVIDKREHEILRNIYGFSKQYEYKHSILFIGSGHRKSIINKIEAYENKGPLKLNWEIPNEELT
jgi:pheromone shutdown protein TraB